MDIINQFFKRVILLLSIYYILVYIYLALIRMFYPFELEWMEGGMVGHIVQIFQGHFLYQPPTIEFIPYIYGPFYFYLSALLSKLMGIGFLPLRFLSIIASLGCFILTYAIVKKETGKHFFSVVAVGLFAATYKISGAWFDIARVDSLFVMLVLCGYYVLNYSSHRLSGFLSGFLLSLAFLTKQSALIIAIPLLFAYFFNDIKKSLQAIFTFGIILIITTLTFDWISEGWYSYYIFELPKEHKFLFAKWQTFLFDDYIKDLFVVCGLAFWFIVFSIFTKHFKNDRVLIAFVIGMLVASYSSRLHVGGYLNCLIPAYAGLVILASLSLNKIVDQINSTRTQITLLSFRKNMVIDSKRIISFLTLLFGIYQFIHLYYPPHKQLPTEEDRKAGFQLINQIKEIEGEVLITAHGFYAYMAGKSLHAHGMAVHDILRASKNTPAKQILIDSLTQAINSKRFQAIIQSKWCDFYPKSILKIYSRTQKLPTKNVMIPVTGCYSVPKFIAYPPFDPRRNQ
ncbi:glycosyltransferase family 39 protein [Candidatus Parabeggiatoa sp. HSG14]|uniref:glycosyltransferase family 39 protein n=1 Tax=Candidatus Parabeggiatoa sp. HSG14 TaxID=3055593 RepID=UPI0025A7DA2E|nr:glycosyltransferase family 39 protein [Thiotrichales bacterium HSG14]